MVRLPARVRRAAAWLGKGLLQPLAEDEARAEFWVRHVRVGVALTEATACVVVAYVVLADRPHRMAVLVTAAFVMTLSPLLLLLPIEKLSVGLRGPLLFYAWSLGITIVIVVIALLDGGSDSPLMWLLVLTMTFVALAYPPLGVMLLGAVMISAYIAVAVLEPAGSSNPPGVEAATLVVAAVLLLFTVMTAWVSRNQWEAYRQQLLMTDRLAELDRAREEFVATTSHELRTPVTSILGYVELLEDDGNREHVPVFLATMRRNAERLRSLSEDLLVLSRSETEKRRRDAGAQQVVSEVDLTEVVQRVRDTMTPLATERQISLGAQFPSAPTVVAGSPEQLERALLNLVSNAVKYTPAGGSVACKVRWSADTAIVEVRDTGIGMTEEDVDQLFTRFFRASSARDHSIAGVGLGLSITHEIVTAHGGRIEVSSRLDVGTTFVVRLPRLVSANGTGAPDAVDEAVVA